MLTLLLKPDEQSYAVTDPSAALKTELSGGRNRYRRDVLNATMEVSVQFTVGPNDYQYLRAFYNLVNKGAEQFFANLLIETSELRTYVCNIRPGSWKLNKVKGTQFTVRMTFEVQPNDDGLDYADMVATYVPFDYSPPPPPADFGGE